MYAAEANTWAHGIRGWNEANRIDIRDSLERRVLQSLSRGRGEIVALATPEQMQRKYF